MAPHSFSVVEGEGKWTVQIFGSSMKIQLSGENFFAEIGILNFCEQQDYVRGYADREKPSPLYDRFGDIMMRRGFDIKGD